MRDPGAPYPRDSIVIVDELATHRRDNLSVGLGWTAPTLSEEIKAMCKQWGVKAQGVADDACFARPDSGSGSLADEFARCGVTFHPAQKRDRISGWQKMRRMLADAGKVDVPGLYITRTATRAVELANGNSARTAV
jgi:hypothetical protein